MSTSRRGYREKMCPPDFVSYQCIVKETDLHISVDNESYSAELAGFTEERILFYRNQLEEYLATDPDFRLSLRPYLVPLDAPAVVLSMTRAGNMAGVGPMAAVAGALAEFVGKELLRRVGQVIVENGGDIFLYAASPIRVVIFAGDRSKFSNRIALELDPREEPYGVCTSSGVVGPSLSFGKADAAVIISASAILSDAVATATANRIQAVEDLNAALEFARSIQGIEGALLIKDDKMAAWGKVKLVRA